MHRWFSIGLDAFLGAAWIALTLSFAARYSFTTADTLFVLGSTLVVGVVSGRYRIALACAVLFVSGAVFDVVNSGACDPGTRCDDDIPLWFAVAYLGVAMAFAAGLMTFGVWLRHHWTSIMRATRPTPS